MTLTCVDGHTHNSTIVSTLSFSFPFPTCNQCQYYPKGLLDFVVFKTSARQLLNTTKPMASQTLIVFLLIMVTASFEVSSCPDYQKQALLEFKFLLLRPNTSSLSAHTYGLETWNSAASNCCKWDFVDCDSSHHVTRFSYPSYIPYLQLDSIVTSDVLSPLFRIQTLTYFDISSNNIHGPFPATGILNLTKLVTLIMSKNKFNGTIPPHFVPPKHLEVMNLSCNLIEGKLGANFFQLGKLQILDLQENFIYGEIPSGIGNLTHLQYLNLVNNELSGSIPLSLFKLRDLSWLDLKFNSLSMEIPTDISNATGIQHLSLSGNKFSGRIPPSINAMTQLVSLNLEDNLLTDEIPSWLFDMRNLTDLKLGGNELFLRNSSIEPKTKLYRLSLRSCNLSTKVPVWLSNQTEFFELDLSDNDLTGTFPDWFIKVNSFLYSLDLSDNKLSGRIPPGSFKYTCLMHLDLLRNHFSGYLPDSIGEYGCMGALLLSSNDFEGPIPKSLSVAPLFTLDLSNNRFSGTEFPDFESLYTLDLSFNDFSGEIPTNLSDNMIVLALSNNQFSGTFPKKLVSLVNLKCLDLHDNNLTGEVPSFLFGISSLQILNLRNNSFEGPIKMNLSNYTRLQIIDLSNNKLSGNIPAVVGKLGGMIGFHHDLFYSIDTYYGRSSSEVQIDYPDLEVLWKALKRNLPSQHLGMYTLLDLSSNQLSGEIPIALGALKNLKLLNISHNMLLGNIPSTIGGLESLESLDMSYNRLSGEIPETLGKLLQLSTLELRNNNLRGRIPTGPQMDRLNNPESYIGNNGLCGIQIQVSCSEETPNKNANRDSNSSEQVWGFSWLMAGIGFPSGFMSTVLVLYIIGFFIPKLKRRQRYYIRAL